MIKSCRICSADFELTDSDLAFLKKVSPVIGGKCFEIPPPTLCYECRLRRRMAWRNDNHLYERKCDFSGKKLISTFRPDAGVKVYDKEIWWGDQWDPLDYSRDYDFSRPFFEQFADLLKVVPNAHTAVVQGENNLYTNYNLANNNCYLCFAGNYLEDSLYCYNAENSRNCVDCLFVYDCELCYQGVQLNGCYNLKYSLNSSNCSDSWFLEDCEGVRDSFMCANLRQKQYCILNKQYPKEEYFAKLAEYRLETNDGLSHARDLWAAERLKFPKRQLHNSSVENCVGEYINQSKNCFDCYVIQAGGEDLKHVFNGFPDFKDSMDCAYSGEKAALMYETMACGASCQGICFSNICFINDSNILYSNFVTGSKNCFGCSNLKNQEYCILNKKYSKSEYEELLPKIIEHMKTTGEWGEYLDPKCSPFGYNETLAAQYFPLEKEEALEKGFNWSDFKAPFPTVAKVIPANQDLPDIDDVAGEIKDWALECEISGRPFKIVKEELDFYRKYKLAVPRKHPDFRHIERLQIRNGFRLFSRNCDQCRQAIDTTYSPDAPEIVYCDKCYFAEVY